MKKLLVLFILGFSLTVQAAMIIETIDLRYRPVEEVIPIIQPLLDEGASVTGTGYKLIIKSTPDNIDDIKGMIKQIDYDQTQLLIHVSVNNRTSMQQSEISAGAQISNDKARVQIGETDDKVKYQAKIFDNRHNRHQPVSQIVRVSEGYWATIQMGQAIPIANRIRNPDGTVTETLEYHQVTTGFRVRPRINGSTVILDVAPQSQSVDPANSGSINTSELQTTISGPLGEWIHLGGTLEHSTSTGSGITHRTRVRETTHNQIWIKVVKPTHATQN